jgi:uncharacterized protein
MLIKSGKTMQGLPLFPLPDFFLFPGAVAPLHIFEPRYRQMVGDLLDTSGRLALVAYRPGGERTRLGPAIMPVGALGEIVHHETLADGRYLIWVLGLGRITLEEVPSDRLYRKTDAQLVHDEEPDPEVVDQLSPRLLAAVQVRAPRGQQLHGDLSLGLLADILLNALPLDAERMAAVFAERCPARRARKALAWHEDC